MLKLSMLILGLGAATIFAANHATSTREVSTVEAAPVTAAGSTLCVCSGGGWWHLNPCTEEVCNTACNHARGTGGICR